ncbi:unnamed protein product [Prorocentrum cordatum]|uniref:Uncharacterized protein n=1 Tax=Prorocentrum cordatum TaxID=2364126 RepID=A0ABN9XTQ4_9DINO|nr:unnamed protein product [Polarella glacialis]
MLMLFFLHLDQPPCEALGAHVPPQGSRAEMLGRRRPSEKEEEEEEEDGGGEPAPPLAAEGDGAARTAADGPALATAATDGPGYAALWLRTGGRQSRAALAAVVSEDSVAGQQGVWVAVPAGVPGGALVAVDRWEVRSDAPGDRAVPDDEAAPLPVADVFVPVDVLLRLSLGQVDWERPEAHPDGAWVFAEADPARMPFWEDLLIHHGLLDPWEDEGQASGEPPEPVPPAPADPAGGGRVPVQVCSPAPHVLSRLRRLAWSCTVQ